MQCALTWSYFVTPRMPTPPVRGSSPKPLANRISDVLILNDFDDGYENDGLSEPFGVWLENMASTT